MSGENSYLDNDGRSIDVTLTSDTDANQVAYVDGFLGILVKDGDSGETRALNIDDRAYQFTVPSSLTVNKGDTVYVDVTDLTGHVPDDSAYYTASGSNRVALFKAFEDKDDNDVVIGKLISGYQA